MAELFENMSASERFNTNEEEFDTVMASDISFKGTITTDKPLFIKGNVIGKIHSKSDIMVDTNAEVDADINSDRVYVRGRVSGNITANRLVYVAVSGSVAGDISAMQVVLELGSNFSGKCTMTRRSQQDE